MPGRRCTWRATAARLHERRLDALARASDALQRERSRRGVLAHRRPRAGRRFQTLRLSPRARSRAQRLGAQPRRRGRDPRRGAGGTAAAVRRRVAVAGAAGGGAAIAGCARGAARAQRGVSNPALEHAGEELHVHVPLDLFTCEECVAELRDPTARRYRYPFINCTQCGPRYTLIRAMPYDRPNTTLDRFALCAECAAEYADPLDRRFHAQPLACPACGPTLYWRAAASSVDGNAAALAAALAALREGQIVAVRGVGGYHLLCDAANEHAVVRLRTRKGSTGKAAGGHGAVARLRRPRLRAQRGAADAARGGRFTRHRAADRARRRARAWSARRNRSRRASSELGVMLPYSPLHHLLLEDFGAALVATSGNVSGEPVLTEPRRREARLAHVADGFLHHDRRDRAAGG